MAIVGLANQYAAAVGSSDFTNRVTVSLCATAQAIASELTTTANHLNRVALGKLVSSAPSAYAPVFALMIAAQGVSDADSDATIANMISACWNCVAGVP